VGKLVSMAPFRPRPHDPVPGSVRSQDVPRLRRLRTRLTRRWQRRQKRHLAFFAVALVALAGTIALGIGALGRAAVGVNLGAVEIAAVLTAGGTILALAVYALWRSDRIRRRARSSLIRLRHVERRLAALRGVEES